MGKEKVGWLMIDKDRNKSCLKHAQGMLRRRERNKESGLQLWEKMALDTRTKDQLKIEYGDWI